MASSEYSCLKENSLVLVRLLKVMFLCNVIMGLRVISRDSLLEASFTDSSRPTLWLIADEIWIALVVDRMLTANALCWKTSLLWFFYLWRVHLIFFCMLFSSLALLLTIWMQWSKCKICFNILLRKFFREEHLQSLCDVAWYLMKEVTWKSHRLVVAWDVVKHVS